MICWTSFSASVTFSGGEKKLDNFCKKKNLWDTFILDTCHFVMYSKSINEAHDCNYDPFILVLLLFDGQAMKLNVSNLYGFPKGLFKVFLSILTSGEEALFLCGGVRS